MRVTVVAFLFTLSSLYAITAETLLDSGYIPGVGYVPRALTRSAAPPAPEEAPLAAGDSAMGDGNEAEPANGADTSVADAGSPPSGAEPAPDGTSVAAAETEPPLSATGPQPVPHGGAYARSEDGGVTIAGAQSWYLEEFDSLQRPVNGTTWTAGKVSKKASWGYYGDTQLVRVRLETTDAGSVETEFDRSGRVLTVEYTDADGNPVSSVKNAYTEDGKLTETVEKTGKNAKRTTYVYANEGRLLEKRGYANGVLELVSRWKDEDNWTETVYSKGKIVLVATYVNGERQKETNAKKR